MPRFSPQRQEKKRTILGIDLRAFSVKVAEVEISPAGKALKKFGIQEFDSSLSHFSSISEHPNCKALKSILEAQNIKTKDAAVCFSGPDVVIKHLTLPKISKADTLEAIKLQVSGWVSFSIDEAIFDFTALKETEGQTHYLVAITKKSLVYETISIIRACGLNLLYVSIIPLALLNLFPLLPKENANEATCLIYMGKHNSNINVFRDGVFEFNREVTVGGDTLSKAMVGVILTGEKRIELDYKQADELKKNFGIPVDLDDYTQKTNLPAVQVLAFQRPALEKIEAELLRSFNYYRSQFEEGEVTNIIITGGASKALNFIEIVKDALGIPVEKGVPRLQPVEAGGEALLPDLAAAIGVALEPEVVRINLLPEEIKNRFKVLLKKAMQPYALGAILFLILLIISGCVLGYGLLLQGSLNSVEAQIKKLTPEVEQADKLERELKGMEEGKTVFSKALKGHKQVVSILERLGRSIPENMVLDNLKIVRDGEASEGIFLSGLAFSFGNYREEVLARFIAGLEGSKQVTNVKLVSAVADQSYAQPALKFAISALMEK